MTEHQHANTFDHIDTASRIQSAINNKKLTDTLNDQRSGQKNDPASRWQRGGLLAEQLGNKHFHPAPAISSTAAAAKPKSDLEDHTPTKQSSGIKESITSTSFSKLLFTFESKQEEEEFVKESKIMTKKMEDQNWLEMLDPKHRYGSNIKFYHRYWNSKADTNQNFLHWLDQGDGKDLSLKECPRKKLEQERITYLSEDQRRNYMTYIDTNPWPSQGAEAQPKEKKLGMSSSFFKLSGNKVEKGRLRWCRTGELVNTLKYNHGDLGNGRGIALRNSEEWQSAVASGEAADILQADKLKYRRRGSDGSTSSFTSCSDASSIDLAAEEKPHPLEAGQEASKESKEKAKPASPLKPSPEEKQQSRREKWLEKANLGPKYLIKKKLGLYKAEDRQQRIDAQPRHHAADHAEEQKEKGEEEERSDTLVHRRKADTWIFVTDLSYNVYIGIKQKGRFQHSSFLGGSIVTVAGILKVKDGLITSIYPWSGHYRSGGDHFEIFVRRLRERGLDTSKINIRKSNLVIEGVNHYGRYRKEKDCKKRELKEKIEEAWAAKMGHSARHQSPS